MQLNVLCRIRTLRRLRRISRWRIVRLRGIRFQNPGINPGVRIRFPLRTPRIRFGLPRIRLPQLRFSVRLPSISASLSRIRFPRIRYPRIRYPRIRYPRVSVRYPRIRVGGWGKKKKRSSCDDCERISEIKDENSRLKICKF